ncbi:MAG: cytochrome P450, partial [Candidatus Dadabacteria bacterium]
MPPLDRSPERALYPLRFYTDIRGLVQHLWEKNGPVFTVPLPFLPITVLMGPDAVEFVLYDRDGNFASGPAWHPFIGRVFPGAIMAMDGGHHRAQRRILQQAFTKTALRGYVDLMMPRIADRVSRWTPAHRERWIRAFPTVKQLTLDVAGTVFMGHDFGRQTKRLNRAFIDTVEAAIAPVRTPIPPLKMWRGVRGRRLLVDQFTKLLPEKRRQATADLFSQLCHAQSEQGERFTDREIIDHMIFVMMAAHDTSTSTLTTMFYLLAKHPEWQERCREEAFRISPDTPDYDRLNQLEQLGWVMKEALRIYPPLTVMPRVAIRDCAFAGYRIQRGTLVGIAPIHTHHMPELWSDPYRFDPERFAP